MNLVLCEDDVGSCSPTASAEQAIQKMRHELPHHRFIVFLNSLLVLFVSLFYHFFLIVFADDFLAYIQVELLSFWGDDV